MSPVRDHTGITLATFNGYWNRGDIDTVPIDHFSDANNIQFLGNSFKTRDGITISQNVAVPLYNIKRIYNYPTQSANTLLVLTWDGTTGKIYHVVSPTLTYLVLTIIGMSDFAFVPYAGRAFISPFHQAKPLVAAPPALTATLAVGVGVTAGTHHYGVTFENAAGETTLSPITAITTAGGNLQVNLTSIAISTDSTVTKRRLWRSPANTFTISSQGVEILQLLTTINNNTATTYTDNTPDAGLGANSPTINTAMVGTNLIDIGLSGQFLYIYAGDGTAARPAAGGALTGTMTAAVGGIGYTDPGLHIFGIVTQTISGYNSPPGALTTLTTLALNAVNFGSIPTSGSTTVVKRLLVASKAIDPTIFAASPDLTGYELFFVPNAVINDNTSTFLNNISFYDADLLADATGLFNNYTAIPAGAVLSLYHERLIVAATATDISLMLVSQPGEPEAINQITGLIVAPLDGNPITNAQEMRDVLYVFKRARTIAYADNGGDSSSWPMTVIDNALGTCVHGIATVLDSGSSSIDYLIICTYQGISQFNGKYVTPELSWKIEAFWKTMDRTLFDIIQIINAPIQKCIYLVLPTRNMLVGNYANGMDWKNIRWCPWTFSMPVNSVAIQNISDIILGVNLT
jgi:hypothetical protein